jgi:hypothetical protein
MQLDKARIYEHYVNNKSHDLAAVTVRKPRNCFSVQIQFCPDFDG